MMHFFQMGGSTANYSILVHPTFTLFVKSVAFCSDMFLKTHQTKSDGWRSWMDINNPTTSNFPYIEIFFGSWQESFCRWCYLSEDITILRNFVGTYKKMDCFCCRMGEVVLKRTTCFTNIPCAAVVFTMFLAVPSWSSRLRTIHRLRGVKLRVSSPSIAVSSTKNGGILTVIQAVLGYGLWKGIPTPISASAMKSPANVTFPYPWWFFMKDPFMKGPHPDQWLIRYSTSIVGTWILW